MLIEATPGRSDQIFSSVSDSVMVVAKSDDGTRSECGLLREAGSVLHVCADFAGGFAAVATSPVVFAEDITEGVMLPTVAGALPLVDFAEVIAADATSLADSGILFLADPAGVVTVGVAPLANAGPVNMAVADLADARILFPADPAGPVTMTVADLANAGILFPFNLVGPVTLGVADLADAGILFPADPARTVTADVAFLADAEEVTVGVIDLAILQDIWLSFWRKLGMGGRDGMEIMGQYPDAPGAIPPGRVVLSSCSDDVKIKGYRGCAVVGR